MYIYIYAGAVHVERDVYTLYVLCVESVEHTRQVAKIIRRKTQNNFISRKTTTEKTQQVFLETDLKKTLAAFSHTATKYFTE